jgi:hypothetical protein
VYAWEDLLEAQLSAACLVPASNWLVSNHFLDDLVGSQDYF